MSRENINQDPLRRKALKVGYWASISVAVFTIIYIIALPLTFNFSPWEGIDEYVDEFKPTQIFTVIPSILLASAFLIFSVCLHYYATTDKKIWSHLGIVFSLVYATISTANYLVQLLSITPSLLNNELDGVTIFVPGYSNSIFYALMGSYLYMTIAAFFMSALFSGGRLERAIKWSFVGVGLSGLLILVGGSTGISVLMPLSGGLWFISLTTGTILVARLFKRNLKKGF